jgi:Fic family protein
MNTGGDDTGLSFEAAQRGKRAAEGLQNRTRRSDKKWDAALAPAEIGAYNLRITYGDYVMTKYIYEYDQWPKFTWDSAAILDPLVRVAGLQGQLLGKMRQFGFGLQQEAMLDALTEEITKSSEIEGEILNSGQVRSSIARQLDMDFDNGAEPSHHVEGVVAMMIDAVNHYADRFDAKRLFSWHAALFPEGYSGMNRIRVAKFRTEEMRVVSNRVGREAVYYEAPPPELVPDMMREMMTWINAKGHENPLVRAATGHLWFVVIHPFDDGNGRIARAITDMLLARAENTRLRFYSMSAQIQREKKDYYKALELTTKGSLDITLWLKWFFECLIRAINSSETLVGIVLKKAEFWKKNAHIVTDDKQREIINCLFDGFEGNLTSGKVLKIFKLGSQDTATRLLQDLVRKGILNVEGAGRGTHYTLNWFSG